MFNDLIRDTVSGSKEKMMINILVEMIKNKCGHEELYAFLLEQKMRGMDRESMYQTLEKCRMLVTDSDEEDTILDLMDFVVGFCRQDLSIFSEEQQIVSKGDQYEY